MLGREKPKVLPFTKDFVAKGLAAASNVDINASSGPSQPALDENRLQEVVQRITNYGKIREMRHSSKDRSYRNISEDDILAMLQGNWKLVATPDWDEAHRGWEYKIKGSDIEGDELVLKIAVNEELQRIDIITKY
jgi:hypothetical protein